MDAFEVAGELATAQMQGYFEIAFVRQRIDVDVIVFAARIDIVPVPELKDYRHLSNAAVNRLTAVPLLMGW